MPETKWESNRILWESKSCFRVLFHQAMAMRDDLVQTLQLAGGESKAWGQTGGRSSLGAKVPWLLAANQPWGEGSGHLDESSDRGLSPCEHYPAMLWSPPSGWQTLDNDRWSCTVEKQQRLVTAEGEWLEKRPGEQDPAFNSKALEIFIFA